MNEFIKWLHLNKRCCLKSFDNLKWSINVTKYYYVVVKHINKWERSSQFYGSKHRGRMKCVNEFIKWPPLNKITCYSGVVKISCLMVICIMTVNINVTKLGPLLYSFVLCINYLHRLLQFIRNLILLS